MRLAFFGTSGFAVPTLARLCENGHRPELVVCQPDRPKGRGRKLLSGPVKAFALAKDLEVFQPKSLDRDVLEKLSRLKIQAAVVVSYGLILPSELLNLPPLGCINLHGSLLPRYRGASPVAHAILRGESVTGATTLLMDEGIDTGPILLQESTPIGPEETAGDVESRLADLGAGLILKTLEGLVAGNLLPRRQVIDRETYAPKIGSHAGRILWMLPASSIARQIRAFNPKPGAFTTHQGKVLKIWRGRTAPPAIQPAAPGTVLAEGGVLRIVCGEGSCLEPQEVQLEGRRRVGGDEALRGRWIASGDRLDDGEERESEGSA